MNMLTGNCMLHAGEDAKEKKVLFDSVRFFSLQ